MARSRSTPKEGTGEPVVFWHGREVWSLAVLADGRLASGGLDGKIKLWPKDGVGEPEVLSHGGYVQSLAVLADGRLASAGADEKIKLWPKEGTGEPTVLSAGGPLAVLADGRLASAGDGKIKLWLVDEQKLIAALCLRAGRNLTKDEWARYIGSDTPWQPSCRGLPSNWRTPDG
jgi:WD40 repeat protein